eukprot:GHVU01061193.1.p1 GENE.GHVU01061193.1~~GHVU01061193.1.p1  ORF type:complete len:136 (-),score=13.56 GHVU01061193.1:533-895(-)
MRTHPVVVVVGVVTVDERQADSSSNKYDGSGDSITKDGVFRKGVKWQHHEDKPVMCHQPVSSSLATPDCPHYPLPRPLKDGGFPETGTNTSWSGWMYVWLEEECTSVYCLARLPRSPLTQ